jgi:hypothetical protein
MSCGQELRAETLILSILLIFSGEFFCLLTLIFKPNAKLLANITDTKFGDLLKPLKNLESTEQPALSTGIRVLETEYALTFALFHCMIGLTLPGIRCQSENLTLHAKKTAFNVLPAKCSVQLQQ